MNSTRPWLVDIHIVPESSSMMSLTTLDNEPSKSQCNTSSEPDLMQYNPNPEVPIHKLPFASVYIHETLIFCGIDDSISNNPFLISRRPIPWLRKPINN